MQGRIWNGAHRTQFEIFIAGLRLGSVSVAALLFGGVGGGILIVLIPGIPGMIFGAILIVIGIVVLILLAFWFQRRDPHYTLPEPVLLYSLVRGARNRTWSNLDTPAKD